MERTYSQVMYDIAKVHEGGTDRTLIPNADWPDIIREFADLPEDRYQDALQTLKVLQRVADLAQRMVH